MAPIFDAQHQSGGPGGRDTPHTPGQTSKPAAGKPAQGVPGKEDAGLAALLALEHSRDWDGDAFEGSRPEANSPWAAVHLEEREPPSLWWSDDELEGPLASPPRRRSASPAPKRPKKKQEVARALFPPDKKTSSGALPAYVRPTPPDIADLASLATFCAAPFDRADSTGLEMLDVARILASSPHLPKADCTRWAPPSGRS